MKVEIEKRPDGSSVLRCTRADGSVTWQKTNAHHGGYFPVHDLIHFSVETTLGEPNAFFGLIAQGWDIADTTGKGPRGPIPPEALAVELFVSLLSGEAASGEELSAAQLREQAQLYAASRGTEVDFHVDDAQLEAIRATMKDLHKRWETVAPGHSLILEFSPR